VKIDSELMYDSAGAISDCASPKDTSTYRWYCVDSAMSSTSLLSTGNHILGRRQLWSATDWNGRPYYARLRWYVMICWVQWLGN